MNKERRKKITEVVNSLKACNSTVEELFDEETNALESLPESMQESERADAMQSAIDALESARDCISEAVEYLTTASE